MSGGAHKITTVKKEKDPRRVEAGKRLASISKAARERKMREKILAESKQNDNIERSDINYGLIFGAIGTIAAIGALYYKRREDARETKGLETIKEDPEVKCVDIQKDVPNSKCNTLDCL